METEELNGNECVDDILCARFDEESPSESVVQAWPEGPDTQEPCAECINFYFPSNPEYEYFTDIKALAYPVSKSIARLVARIENRILQHCEYCRYILVEVSRFGKVRKEFERHGYRLRSGRILKVWLEKKI